METALPAMVAKLLEYGVAGLGFLVLLWDRLKLAQRIRELENDVKESQNSRLADLKEISKDATKALTDAARVMQDVAQESGRSAENTRILSEVFRPLKDALERFMAQVRP